MTDIDEQVLRKMFRNAFILQLVFYVGFTVTSLLICVLITLI